MAGRDIDPGAASRGRSGNDYLQRGGEGYQSWGAEGPGGMSATGGPPPDVGDRGPAAAREWGSGVGGGYGRSGTYGVEGGRGLWQGADAGGPGAVDREGIPPLVQEHWLRGEGRSSRLGMLLAGIGIGAAIMYFLDPARGTRRRHVLAARATSRAQDARETARVAAMDLRNRAAGTIAEVRGRMSDEQVTDEQLVARVRAELGHHVERVRPIEVVAEGGSVTLRGSVSPEDLPRVVATVQRVRGVQHVVNNLEITPEAGGAT